MPAKKRTTNRGTQTLLAARVFLRLAPMLDRLVALTGRDSDGERRPCLALMEHATQLAAVLAVAPDRDCGASVKTTIGIAGLVQGTA